MVNLAFLAFLSLAAPTPQAGSAATPTTPDGSDVVRAIDTTLHAKVEALVRDKSLSDARIGFRAVRVTTGEVIAEYGAQVALNPASNVKLFTTATALAKLGVQHSYPTRVYFRDSEHKDGTLHGDLYIRAGADPALVTGDVFEIAQTLQARGLQKIEGRLVLQIDRFSGEGLPPGFEQKDELASYRSAAGAASVNYNTFVVWVRPASRRGAPATVSIVPPVRGISIENSSTTVSGSSNRAQVFLRRQESGETVIVVQGKVGERASERSARLPRYDPSNYAAEVFTQALQAAGIELKRKDHRLGPVPEDAQLALRRDSAPLGVLIRSVNKHSNNFMAEQILWSLAPAAGAKPEDGLAVVRAFTQEIEMPQQGLFIGNGSGLYDTNRISATQVTHLLMYMHNQFSLRADYLASLAIMGVDGTTRRRLRRSTAAGWVRAKTGTLDGVSALSGYVSAPNQEPIAFSILVNDFATWKLGRVRRLQDRLVVALSAYLRGREDAPDAADEDTASDTQEGAAE